MSLQIKSTFFTETVGISQTDSQAFGPNGNTTTDKEKNFRVSSSFTASGSKKAFAVCKGRAFVQPQTGSTTKVNLILQPIDQPCNRLPIKYFVYRGLDYASFFHSQNTSGGDKQLITNENLTKASDFVKRVWEKFKSFNALPANTTEPLLAKWIGFDPSNQTAVTLIDSFFYKISSNDLSSASLKTFELPNVEKGDWIGNFGDGQEFSFEVVLDTGNIYLEGTGFNFDLTYARAASWTFNSNTLPTGAIDEKTYREAILNFMDSAAYWGEHFDGGELEIFDNNHPTITGPPFSGQNVYDKVVQLFETRNSVYIHIQSDRGHSYNFYRNYEDADSSTGDAIMFGPVGSLTAQKFNTYKWPLIIPTFTPVAVNNRNNFGLKLITDNNKDIILYAQNGQLESENKGNFVFYKALYDKDDSQYTKEIKASVPSEMAGNSVSSLIRLIYKGQQLIVPLDIPIGAEEVHYAVKPLDEAFIIEDRLSPFETESGQYIISMTAATTRAFSFAQISNTNPTYIAFESKINFDYINQLDTNATPPTQQRVFFETCTVDIAKKSSLAGNVISQNMDPGPDKAYPFEAKLNNFYQILERPFPDAVPLEIYPNLLTGYQYRAGKNDQRPTKFLLGISKDEYDILTGIITTKNLRVVSVFFDIANKNDFSTLDDVNYSKMTLGVIGDDDDGITKIYLPANEISVYTIDQYVYFTEEYTKNLPKISRVIIDESAALNAGSPKVPSFESETK